jgi:imidazole glycerol-phosphate synthase subunit HisH
VKKISVTVLNYNVGNHGSLIHSLKSMGFYVRISENIQVLKESDVVILPGVGAFPSAMQELERLNLVDYLIERANKQQPIIGICLGMQLLAERSYEHKYTLGLGIIPGEFIALKVPQWHIGWNTLVCTGEKQSVTLNRSFYFNHSYIYNGPSEYQVCTTTHEKTFASIIRNKTTIGLQFHPEKSQESGRTLLKELINEVCDA